MPLISVYIYTRCIARTSTYLFETSKTLARRAIFELLHQKRYYVTIFSELFATKFNKKSQNEAKKMYIREVMLRRYRTEY